MKEYREKLKTQNITIAVGCFALVLFSVAAVLNELGVLHFMPATGDGRWASRRNGFLCGAAIGILASMIVALVKNIRALGDEQELKKLYVREHDERQIQIWTKARAAATQTFLMLGLVAGVIAGYFSMSVSITILACVTIHAFIGLAYKIYYGIKL